MIQIDDLTKSFGSGRGKLLVLRGVNLTATPGRVLALVGPNGAGKSTLVKCILGLIRPNGGRILLDGETIDDSPGYRARIGYMPQIAHFPENISAADLLAFLRSLRGAAARTDEELLERFRLEAHLHKPLRTLSGGSRQKVNAVIAFLFRPDVLILDEPTSGLDPVSSSALKDTILAARGEGRTVIVASHVMSELEELADDVAVMLEGRVRHAGPVHDLKVATRQLNLERAIASLMLDAEAA